MTLRDGARPGTFKAFAARHVGRGLTLLTHAHVNKVIIEDNTAVGVEVRVKFHMHFQSFDDCF